MTNISDLFSPIVELQEFNTKNINHIPSFGSIIYTVFLDRSEYIYVGIGGLSGKSVQYRNLFQYKSCTSRIQDRQSYNYF